MDQQHQPVPTRPQVVDVKPPEQTTPQVPPEVAASMLQSEQEVATAPAAPAAAVDDVKQPPSTEGVPATQQIGTQETQDNTQRTETKSAVTPASVKRPIVMILLAILVGLGLAALSVYAYMMTNGAQDDKATSQQASDSESAELQSAVDETSSDIERSLNSLNSEKDFPESELSDETLGL